MQYAPRLPLVFTTGRQNLIMSFYVYAEDSELLLLLGSMKKCIGAEGWTYLDRRNKVVKEGGH